MPSIAEFSEEPKYTIKTVCTQTGIRAVTLRAWERRHEILTPHRSENRYRLYSERDVAILRWIKNRVDTGLSISSAAEELHNFQQNGLWPDAIPTAPVIQVTKKSETPPQLYAKQLFQALIEHNEAKAGDILREIHAIFDLTTIFVKIITPALVDIGEAWYRGEIRITTEHFASAYIRGKLLTLYQAYPSRRNSPYILVGCAPTEQHEIGSLMAAVLLRSNGYRVEYLGPDVPLEDLVDYASFEHPDMILMTASLEPAVVEMVHIEEKLKKVRPIPIFAYAGGAFTRKPDLRKRVPGCYLGDSLDSVVSSTRDLITDRNNVKNAKIRQ